ncbi:NAD(P)/FAD-dependent oxidoreductase [Pseudothauera nasutitermitis]|jgi:putative flavoprotein involved in K+ transport|uniref:NAD(P)/FAD-dependent oxidoreductase n=1 Tax=Pseudothauera nasutitermitis TaxID=2565930 RepID=A0A4S4B5V4_9RHOO|nr:NAD(P)-binding domain-containing protein [Pseudothauera nasutitermitis]THF66357.1 NAD(P)/FAD-dependent oxidoreductase [Pseudothauera nasutitermitis]
MKILQTLVIGGGQAGLATGWHLAQRQIDFLILEASDRSGGAWRSYYDSLELFSPAGYSALPGLPFPGPQRRYPHRDEVVGYLDEYAHKFRLPVRVGEKVVNVVRDGDAFEAVTASGQHYRAKTLVAASGAFGMPHVPAIEGQEQFRGCMLHSAEYLNPKGFLGSRIVVVGGANSAVQIATELAGVARVKLATLQPIRFFPQRILGLDFHFWVKWTGLEQTRWLNDQSTPVLDNGKYSHAIKTGRVQRQEMFTRITERGVIWPDGTEEQVDVLLFATGFRPNASYLRELGAVSADNRLAQQNGIAQGIPGLYFVGFPRQRNFASATLRGAGADAAHIMPYLIEYLRESDQQVGKANTTEARTP